MVLDRVNSSFDHKLRDEPQPRKMLATWASHTLKKLAFFGYGLFTTCLFIVIALSSGSFFKKPTEQAQLQLKIARDKFWNLSKQPLPGFHHAFFTLRTGLKLHYICNKQRDAQVTPGDLVVFIHGFPDSSMMWRHMLQETKLPASGVTLVCVDLPGFGGSDNFVKYDTSVLEALTEFIVTLREQYTQSEDGNTEGNTIIVGHDWGCTLTFRLACDAPGLADHFVASNGILIDLAKANSKSIIHSSSKIFRQFRSAPWKNRACLGKTCQSLKPLLKQLLLSGYIFAFNQPDFIVRYLGVGGNMSFIRGALHRQNGKSSDEYNAPESLASTLGPGVPECKSGTKPGLKSKSETYGISVLERAKDASEAFLQQTAYYRDRLAIDPWDKSIETITDLYNLEAAASGPNSAYRRRSSSASSTLFTEHFKGSLRAPTTIIWGEDDLAISRSICLDGISDYLAKGSEVILLPRSGHWTAIEKESRVLLAKTIESLVGKNQSSPIHLFQTVKASYKDCRLLVHR